MFRPLQTFEESDMRNQDQKFSFRKAVESAFAGVMSAAILAVIAGGTIAMCVPGAAGLVA
jgi:hypothetical protein